MTQEQTQTATPKFTPQRKAWVWQYVIRCIDKAGPDERRKDAYKLVNQQLASASDEGGKQ